MKPDKPLVFLGAGAQARCAMEVAVEAGWEVRGMFDLVKKGARSESGYTILGHVEELTALFKPEEIRLFIGIGSNRQKKETADRFSQLGYEFATLVSPLACVRPGVKIGVGTVIHPFAMVMGLTTIGNHVKVDPHCFIAHDNVIHSFVSLAPSVRLTGYVCVHEGASLFTNAVVIPKNTIGAWATVAAGSVVMRNVPEGVTVMGNPARRLSFK